MFINVKKRKSRTWSMFYFSFYQGEVRGKNRGFVGEGGGGGLDV